MTKNLATLLCILMIGPALMASTPVNGMTATQKEKARKELLDKFSGTLSTTFQTNLYEFKDEANKTFSNFTSGSLNFRSVHGFTLSTGFLVVKDLRNEREQSVRDPSITVSVPVYGSSGEVDLNKLRQGTANEKTAKKATQATGQNSKRVQKSKVSKTKSETKQVAKTTSGTLNISMRGSVILPLSDRSKYETSLRTGVVAAPLIIYSVDPALIPGLTFIGLPSAVVYSHKYKVDTAGNSNTAYSTTARLLISYSFNSVVSLSLDNLYSRAWTYEGEYNDQFSFDQSLNFNVYKGFSIYAGHSIGGSALDVNGQDSNLKAFDSRESEIYTGVSYRF